MWGACGWGMHLVDELGGLAGGGEGKGGGARACAVTHLGGTRRGDGLAQQRVRKLLALRTTGTGRPAGRECGALASGAPPHTTTQGDSRGGGHRASAPAFGRPQLCQLLALSAWWHSRGTARPAGREHGAGGLASRRGPHVCGNADRGRGAAPASRRGPQIRAGQAGNGGGAFGHPRDATAHRDVTPGQVAATANAILDGQTWDGQHVPPDVSNNGHTASHLCAGGHCLVHVIWELHRINLARERCAKDLAGYRLEDCRHQPKCIRLLHYEARDHS
jgi:hypothetical protein